MKINMITFSLVIASALMRPGFLGQQYSSVGILLLIFLVAYVVLFSGIGASKVFFRENKKLLIPQILFWKYCFLVSLFSGVSNMDFVVKATIIAIISQLCYFIVFSFDEIREIFFDNLATLISLIGYSIFISTIIILYFGEGFMEIGRLSIEGYSSDESVNGVIVFPFSVLYGKLSDYGIYKFVGIWRESGIAQAFFVWAIFYAIYSRKNIYHVIGAILGAIFCGSTAVAISLGCAIFFAFFLKGGNGKKDLFVILALLVIAYAFFNIPGFGINDKSETHGSSIDDRYFAMYYALYEIDSYQFIFGGGLYSNIYVMDNLNINSIAYISGYGVIGFVLWVICYFICPIIFRDRSFLVLASPFFVTALFSQPLVDAPSVYLMLFSGFVCRNRKLPRQADS